MNILHTVEFYHPSVGGSQEVVKQLSERLVARGHQVTVATTHLDERTESEINGVYLKTFKASGNMARGFDGEIDNYRQFLRTQKFDIMMNYAAQQWATDAVLDLLPELPYSKVMVPCGFSGLYEPKYAEFFKVLPNYLKQYDHLVFLSENYRDINFAKSHGLQSYSIIPNGAGANEFKPTAHDDIRQKFNIPKDAFVMLTVGNHTAYKGHRFAIDVLRRLRMPNVYLVIVGKFYGKGGCGRECLKLSQRVNFWSFGKKKVLLLDIPRKDVVDLFHASDLFVFGSNIECSPLVLFEAMAAKLPFATVPCGNAAEIIDWSAGGVLINGKIDDKGYVDGDMNHAVNEITKLYYDRAKLAQLGNAGYQAWQEKFTWEKIAESYESLYLSLIHQANSK